MFREPCGCGGDQVRPSRRGLNRVPYLRVAFGDGGMRCEEQVSQRGTKEARLLKMRAAILDAFRAARICPSCERAIETGETLLIQHPAGTGQRRSANAKRVKRVVSGGLPELGKKR